MFGRNTGKPLKGPTMGAHTILEIMHVSMLYVALRLHSKSSESNDFTLLCYFNLIKRSARLSAFLTSCRKFTCAKKEVKLADFTG